MKKEHQKTALFSSDTVQTKDSEQIKTTNVNVLLNRVRLDKKKTFRKRIIFSLFLASLISSISIYFII